MRLVDHEDLRAKGITFSKPHLWRLIRAGKFPRQVKIGLQKKTRGLRKRSTIGLRPALPTATRWHDDGRLIQNSGAGQHRCFGRVLAP
jgi:hypothetical protein